MKRKLNLNERVSKYIVARKKGLTQSKSKEVAGYPQTTNGYQIEQSDAYKTLEQTYFKDEIIQRITLGQIADEQVKVIKQDKDLGAKNTAIKNTLERIEPNEIGGQEDDDKLVVILRP